MWIKRSRRKYYTIYTIYFVVLISLVYGYFCFLGKSFVDSGSANNGDGLIQHYTALCYYSRYLRDIIRTLFVEHRLVIPEWSFSIGYGSDIISTLHYYVIGDPFNLLSIAVPFRFMPYYYSLMIILRLYCAGVAFSAYCFYMVDHGSVKFDESTMDHAVLAGTVLYLFGLYGMRAGISHPYFINPMIYFPLLLLGVEKTMKKENPLLLMITVALSACSNFYFFYMLVIMVVLYVVLRLIFVYGLRNIRKVFIQIVQIGLHALIGLGMGMVLFLPVVRAVFQDIRFGSTNLVELLYPQEYYTKLLAGFISEKNAGSWCMLGFAAIALVAVILLFARRKENRTLKAAFLTLTLFLFIPIINCVLNAFAYAASRWIWAYAFMIAYILVCMWPYLLRIGKKEARAVCTGLFVYFVLCFVMDNSRTANLAFSMVCAFAVLCVCMLEEGHIVKERYLLLIITVNIGINGYFLYSYKSGDILKKYLEWDKVNTLVFESFDNAVMEADAKNGQDASSSSEFYRFSQDIINNNATLLSGMHSTQYYWSLSNSSVIEANDEFGISGFTHNIYYDMNSRTRLTSLANVKYYVTHAGKGIKYAPYGFESLGTYVAGNEEYAIYKNMNMLPFGYTYDSILNSNEFESLNPVQKESAVFEGAYTGDHSDTLPTTQLRENDVDIPFEITCSSDKVSQQGKTFVTTSDNASVTLTFDGKEKCETFLQIIGFKYHGCSPLELYQDDTPFDPLNLYTEEAWNSKSLLEKKELQYKNRNWAEESMMSFIVNAVTEEGLKIGESFFLLTPDYTWYSGKEDYTINLHYSDSRKTSIEIVFPYAGIYSYEDMKISCLSVEGYEEGIRKLSEEHLENVVFDTDMITGSITVSNNKMLCLTIPYTDGWTAYVDGRKTPVIRTNYMYSGVMLDEGKHEIRLEYHTPGLRLGGGISVLSFGILMVLMIRRKKQCR